MCTTPSARAGRSNRGARATTLHRTTAAQENRTRTVHIVHILSPYARYPMYCEQYLGSQAAPVSVTGGAGPGHMIRTYRILQYIVAILREPTNLQEFFYCSKTRK